MALPTTTEPTVPYVQLPESQFHDELAYERRFTSVEKDNEAVNLEVKRHNSHRSKLIQAKTALKNWDEITAPITTKDGVRTKVVGTIIHTDPFPALQTKLGIKDRVFEIAATIPRAKVDAEVKEILTGMQRKFKSLRSVSCVDWMFRLERIADEVLRVRIAKLVWWDLASTLKQQNCVLTEMVNAPITTAQIASYTKDQVAIELWRLGWPASMATDRAHFAQQ